jgi:hypothetical protein
LDASVVLSRAIVELNSDPVTRGKCGLADKADGARAIVAEADLLADSQIRDGRHRVILQWTLVLFVGVS